MPPGRPIGTSRPSAPWRASHALLRGEGQEARRLALAAGRLCEEIAGFGPRDSWKPIG
jgi:hypothetical protein